MKRLFWPFSSNECENMAYPKTRAQHPPHGNNQIVYEQKLKRLNKLDMSKKKTDKKNI